MAVPTIRVPAPAASAPRPSTVLTAVAVAVAVLFAAPLGYLVVRVVGFGTESLDVLTDASVWRPLQRTVTLAASVSLSAAVVGTGLAWLTTRTDLPLRRVWALAAPLPLVYPSFVGAAALLAAVAPGGLLDSVLPWVDTLPEVEGFGGAWYVLTLFTYPYVFLPVAARLGSLSPGFEEGARLLGKSPWVVFRSVVLPQASSAIWAGSLLVFLYVVSDFGAVAQLRYRTLTVEVYENRLQDRALVLGLLLGVVALAVVALERAVGRRRAVVEAARSKRPLQLSLGRWRWPALAAVAVVAGNALLGPLSVLGFWAVKGLTGGGRLGATDVFDLVGPARSTAVLAVTAAVLAVAVVLPVAFLTTRHRSPIGGAVNAAVVAGFALPGLLIALSVVFWTLSGPSWTAGLYQTAPLLVLAYVVHFGAQAMRATQVAVSSVPRRLDDAARTLGASRVRRLRSVDLPLMLPGLAAGAGLVLLSTIKELPATLLLRPTGTDTLALEVWRARETANWPEAGLAGLALVLLSAVLTWVLILRRMERFD
jgi:iron(III) transport system permease protein